MAMYSVEFTSACLIFCTVLASFHAYHSNDPPCLRKDFPYLLPMRADLNRANCVANVIHHLWVLSCAACFEGIPEFPPPTSIIVRLGESDKSVKRVVRHYRLRTYPQDPILINDVVLAQVTSSFEFIIQFKLPTSTELTDQCKTTVLMRTTPDDPEPFDSFELECLEYVALDTSECFAPHIRRADGIMCSELCSVSSWRARVGEPLTCKGSEDTVIGIVSDPNVSSLVVFTRVDYYLEFINMTIYSDTAFEQHYSRSSLTIPDMSLLLFCLIYCIIMTRA